MWKRMIVACLLLIATVNARALEYTDVYVDADPAQTGWGAFLVQSDRFQFIAFFIYGPDKLPTWYTAQLTDDGTGRYTGGLYATRGTYFPLPWNPADHPLAVQVGTATFQPSDAYHATLTYTVNGVGTVVKSVVRQALTSYPMSGSYSGAMAGSVGGCNDPSSNIPSFRGNYDLTITQVDDTSATAVLTFLAPAFLSGVVCTVSGSLSHFGRIYQLGGTMACTGPNQNGNAHPATIDSLHPTGQGIEGKLTANTGGGCTGVLHFSAVLNVDH